MKTYPIIIEIKSKPLGYTTVHDEIYNLPLKDVERDYGIQNN
jgi:hypothetical protein